MNKQLFTQKMNDVSKYNLNVAELERIINDCNNDNKLKKLKSFYNSLSIVRRDINKTHEVVSCVISPIFALNAKDGISISKPALTLNMTEIKRVFNFSHAIQFSNLEELVAFYRRFNAIIWRLENQSSFLVIGTTLYANIITSTMDIMPIPFIPSEEYKQMEFLIAEFNREYKNI